MANEPITSAVWITPDGMRASNNITFTHLSTSNTGVYTCSGTIQEQTVSSIIDLRISSELTDSYMKINVFLYQIFAAYYYDIKFVCCESMAHD